MENDPKRERILLVDGHGLAYRGFYALPEMNAPDGTPTNAVLGFMNMLLKAAAEWRPDGFGLFFDPKGPTARNEMYGAYKEGRQPTPDAFKAQMPLILDLLDALGYPVFVRDGVEADDLIAATADALETAGAEALILTADKDLLQILRGGMKMARPSKGISEFKLYDAETFREEYGFPAPRMADYLALVGDAVDNIPGVAGIGDKTARSLLAAHGSLDGIYEALESLPKGQRAKLEAGRDAAYMSYELVVPQPVDAVEPERLHMGEGDSGRAAEICRRLGLKSLLARLDLDSRPVARKAADEAEDDAGSAVIETDLEQVLCESFLVLAELPDLVMTPEGKWAALDDAGWERLEDWLSEKEHVLLTAGYRAWCRKRPALRRCAQRILDVELAHYFYHPDAKTHELAKVTGNYPGTGIELAQAIYALWEKLRADGGLEEEMLRVTRGIDVPLTPPLLSLKENGLGVDLEALRRLDAELAEHTARIEREINEVAGEAVNLNSPKQVGELLFGQLRLPVVKKTKTGYSTDVSVLEELARLPQPLGEVPAKLLDYRESAKMSSGFVQPFLKHVEEAADGRIHSTFLQDVTGTGRLASRDPNVQNLPLFGDWAAKFRRAVVPSGKDRVFVAADYSQIELRVLAHLSGEQRLREAFRDGLDIHLQTASWVFGLEPEDITPEQRRFAKTVNFGLLYGMGAHGLAVRAGITRQQAAGLVDRYFAALPSVKRYMERSAKEARERGYTRSVFGRIRPLAEVSTIEGRGGNPIDRVAVNTPIQSTASDIAKIALIRFHKALAEEYPQARLVLQVHDSLICEAPEGEADGVEALLVRTMEAVEAIDVPLKAEPKRGRSLADV